MRNLIIYYYDYLDFQIQTVLRNVQYKYLKKNDDLQNILNGYINIEFIENPKDDSCFSRFTAHNHIMRLVTVSLAL